MHRDDLESEDVLAAIVSDFEDRALPGVVLFLLGRAGFLLDVDQLVLRFEIVELRLVARPADLERRHERGLQAETR